MKTASIRITPQIIDSELIKDRFEITPQNTKYSLIGYTPCTLKQTFRDGIDRAAVQHFKKTGKELNYFASMGCGGTDDLENIWQSKGISDLPDVIVSLGFGDFFRPEFRTRFIDTGMFTSVLPDTININFIAAGIPDPEKRYTIYGLHPYVMLIDQKLLGDLPVPESWSALLSPVYKDKIIIGGNSDEVSEVLLMHIFKEHGEEGIRALARNVKAVWHGSQMGKFAGSGREEGAAIYIISHFFAKAAPLTDSSFIHIPSEGIIASPLYMLVKNGSDYTSKIFTDFVLGNEFGKAMSDAHYPALNGEACGGNPERVKIKWIGWDYIRNNDIFSVRENANKIFRDERPDL